MFAEQLMHFAQAATLVERRQFQILRLNADGSGNMVANQIEPRELFCAKGLASSHCCRLVHEPFVEPFGHGVGEGREHGLLFQRKTDEGYKVGKASGLRTAFNVAGFGGSEGIPEIVLSPGGMVVAQFLFQFLEHRLGQALLERTAVKDLQRGDLGLVLFDVIAEGFQEVCGLFFRSGVETLMCNNISGDGINGLLILLLELHQRVTQGGLVEWGAGFENQCLLRGLKFFRRDFGG